MLYLQELRHDPVIVRLFFAFIVLICMLIVKRFLGKWIIRILSHLKFQKVRLNIETLSCLEQPINILIWLTGITLALVVSPLVYSSTPMEQVLYLGEFHIPLSMIPIHWIAKLYLSLMAGTITWIIYEIEQIYERFFTELNEKLVLIDNTVFIRYLSRIINFLTLAFGLMVALIILIPDLSGIITGVGIGGAAVAFIAKDSLAGIVSGVFLLLDKPFVIGDVINIGDVEGHVEDISFRSTRVRTFSQSLVIIPNNTISNENITNWSKLEKKRVSFVLGLSYDTSPDVLKECIQRMQETIKSFNMIEKDTVVIHFTSFGDYSLNIQIIYYTYHTTLEPYLKIQEEVNIKLLELCQELHIDIAFPTQTIISYTSPSTL